MANQLAQHASPSGKDSPSITPRKVAVPLPPLNLRKIVKQPSLIQDVERTTDAKKKKAFRQKAQGREVTEYKYDYGTPESVKLMKKQTPGQNEAKDPGEYDYEGDMAKTQLRAMIDQAQDLIDMFEDNENVYLLKKNDGESNKYYFMKSNFISQIKPLNEKELNYYLNYANIYCNKKLLNMEYNIEVNNKLTNIINKFKIEL